MPMYPCQCVGRLSVAGAVCEHEGFNRLVELECHASRRPRTRAAIVKGIAHRSLGHGRFTVETAVDIDLRPRDMIDVQSFMWVQGSEEYA